MPVYEYECKQGHRTERVVFLSAGGGNEPLEKCKCEARVLFHENQEDTRVVTCGKTARLVPSRTGKPILKAGIGGFYSPNAR